MKKTISAFPIKVLAIAAMLINHIGHAFSLEQRAPFFYDIALYVGILTFPIMSFLLVEGFYYTRNRCHYAFRLLAFAVLSIVPFHWALNTVPPQPLNYVNNIFFTLFLGLVCLIICEKLPTLWLHIPFVVLFSYLSTWSDWGPQGVVLIYGFYLAKKCNKGPIIPLFLFFLFMFYLYWQYYVQYPGYFSIAVPLSTLGILCLIPLLWAYNGQRGYSPAWVKWGFYCFYPAHLLVLAIIRYSLFGF